MTITEFAKQIGKEVSQQRTEEQGILNQIAAATSLDFAQQAADTLSPKKHLYSFEAYLTILDDLKELLYAGMPNDLALESAQSGFGAETILTLWRNMK